MAYVNVHWNAHSACTYWWREVYVEFWVQANQSGDELVVACFELSVTLVELVPFLA